MDVSIAPNTNIAYTAALEANKITKSDFLTLINSETR